MKNKKIRTNKIKCLKCGDIIESTMLVKVLPMSRTIEFNTLENSKIINSAIKCLLINASNAAPSFQPCLFSSKVS